VRPEDVWREMERREDLLGIAEKLPKSAAKMSKEMRKASAPPRIGRRPVVALASRNLTKRG
jgi:phosphoribosyl-ATP pyrophosphohydrolase